MNKKILTLEIVIILVTLGILVGLNIRKQRLIKHQQQLLKVSEQIAANTYLSLMIIDGLSSAWSTAVDGDLNSSEVVLSYYEKLTEYASTLEESTDKIEAELQNLKNSPYKKEERFSALLEVYGIYNQLKSLALAPTGSMLSYGFKINDLSSEYTKVLSK